MLHPALAVRCGFVSAPPVAVSFGMCRWLPPAFFSLALHVYVAVPAPPLRCWPFYHAVLQSKPFASTAPAFYCNPCLWQVPTFAVFTPVPFWIETLPTNAVVFLRVSPRIYQPGHLQPTRDRSLSMHNHTFDINKLNAPMCRPGTAVRAAAAARAAAPEPLPPLIVYIAR